MTLTFTSAGTKLKLTSRIFFPFQGSLIVQVQAVDGDSGVGNAVEYEIIDGKYSSTIG